MFVNEFGSAPSPVVPTVFNAAMHRQNSCYNIGEGFPETGKIAMLDSLKDYLQNAPSWVSLFVIGIPSLLAGIFLFAAFWARRNARALLIQKPVFASQVEEGYRLVQGKVHDGSNVKAPLTGRQCAWYDLKIDESIQTVTTDSSSSGRKVNYTWRTVREKTSSKPILIMDGTTTCLIKTDGAIAYVTDWSEWYGPEKTPTIKDPEKCPGTMVPGGAGRIEVHGTQDGRFRYLERYIYSGDPIFALGDVRLAKSGSSGEKEFILDEPGGKRPFIISARSPQDILAENQLAFKGGFIMSVLCGSAAIFLSMLKFA